MERVAAVIPAWNCGASLAAVLERLPLDIEPIVVDDGSAPPLGSAPLGSAAERAVWLRHPRNRGYGAAQKTGYAAALARGATQVVLVHGDDQYDVADTLALLPLLAGAPAALGSRFLAGPAGIPRWRRWGNRVLTGLANQRFGSRHTELHTGARAFQARLLEEIPFGGFSDDYLFDQQILLYLLRRGVPVAEGPVRFRYDDTTQSIPVGKAIRYAAGCLREIARA